MKRFFRSNKKTNIILAALLLIVFGQSFVIGKLYADRDDKNYQVNLVKINTTKDSIDHRELKENLLSVDQVVRNINAFLVSKNASDLRIESLAKDSLANEVYLSKQSNRYSQYLVDLEKKLQQVPLGVPTSGYISSNFGIRKNPIPFKTVFASVKTLKPANDSTSLANNSALKDDSKADQNALAEKDQMQFHKGIDVAVAYGTDVVAAAAGKVLFAGQKGGYGNCVIVSHANGLATLYGHLSSISVSANQEVKVGEVIAKSGNSGRSTGPHLHYEVHRNNTPVNPKLFMNL
ncbi:M23 family metallopeptidase [Chryseobacterium sp. POL2]|uniref:M23 family metallopeptidase n=1 Tax=Chryseobacterium sp. POL2 TaxID=2713414 RepID=UPI0013E14B16|nr:M23 family metallopeptidase [Chryseobacterium sp. POL2]QIG89615.1 M23 family metallopeptidase [Chryseobacterium sp. POL2]